MNEIFITGLAMDSRRVKPGDLFIAVPGLTVDGRNYIQDAIHKGAAAVLVEAPFVFKPLTVPVILVSNLSKLISSIAGKFYHEPSCEMSVIGITGTNGKTSCTHFIAQILNRVQKSCGIMGTLGVGFLNNLDETFCTTPDAITVQKELAVLKVKGATTVAMEVTSHALHQERVSGVHFKTVVFTNLTRDHLDYHNDMHTYWEIKKKLFTEFEADYCIINLDDDYGRQLINELSIDRQIIGYTTSVLAALPENRNAGNLQTISVSHLVLDEGGLKAHIQTPWGEGHLNCSLFGQFNLSNLLAAIACVCLEGVPLKYVLDIIPEIQTVPGRMMRFGGKNAHPVVIVDYAHTPDALAKVLQASRAHCSGKLWCVFGCGGDRDRGKRPLMAQVAVSLSDEVVMTQDNPRTEDPKLIFEDMLQGIPSKSHVRLEYDRKKAIIETILNAKVEDCVVIAGKGHEDYQIIGRERKSFLDQAVVEEALNRRTA